MPVLNIPLLKETLAYVEAHPEEHDQSEWRCGTTLCFAGHAAVLAGGRWRVAPGPVYERSPLRGMDYMEPEPEDPEEDIIVSRADLLGEVIHVADRARRVLGLTEEEAEDLFMQPNLMSLKHSVKRLVQDEMVGSQ